MPDWISDVVAIGALIVAALAAYYAKRSADVAESARDEAAKVARAELSRDHEALRPKRPEEPKFPYERSGTLVRNGRFLTFHVDHTYRIAGDSITGQSRSPLNIPVVAEAGRDIRVYVDQEGGVPVDRLHFRFWPPVPGDPGEPWTCPCGANVAEAGPPHWEWNIEVPKPRDIVRTVR